MQIKGFSPTGIGDNLKHSKLPQSQIMKYHILLRIMYRNVLKDMGPDILLYNPGKRKKN